MKSPREPTTEERAALIAANEERLKRQKLLDHLRHVRRRYGLDQEAYLALVKTATHCPICKRPFGEVERRFDCYPKTRAIRGFICNRCFFRLRRFERDETWCLAAAAYLTHPPVPKSASHYSRAGVYKEPDE